VAVTDFIVNIGQFTTALASATIIARVFVASTPITATPVTATPVTATPIAVLASGAGGAFGAGRPF
jgi:hypothetical protein